jgi:hypothetical protein
MASHLMIIISFILLISIANICGQCTDCAADQGCCMGHMHGQWRCCAGQTLNLNNEKTPWNFNLQIKYTDYGWDCSASNRDPTQKYTNVSCILDGRWSLNRLTFQLRSIPSDKLTSIIGEYRMKDAQPEKIVFQADSQWGVTLPVHKNEQPGVFAIYDTIQFNYGGFNYTYSFGYGPMPTCPRC